MMNTGIPLPEVMNTSPSPHRFESPPPVPESPAAAGRRRDEIRVETILAWFAFLSALYYFGTVAVRAE